MHGATNMYSFGQRFDYLEEEKSDWSVNPRYQAFQDELLKNKLCSIEKEVYDVEYKKCEQYMDTSYTKKLEQRSSAQLLFEYILALLIYCNCDDYQRKWSLTFRRMPENETDKSLKKLHSYFYYSSLYLRNLVENFGESLINEQRKVFYHGVSEIVYFVKTIARFSGPLSTSEEPQVALTFSKNKGVIL